MKIHKIDLLREVNNAIETNTKLSDRFQDAHDAIKINDNFDRVVCASLGIKSAHFFSRSARLVRFRDFIEMSQTEEIEIPIELINEMLNTESE